MAPAHTPKRSSSQVARRATLRADAAPARVTRRRPETRGRLLDAAFGVFATRGFGRASIEEVCRAAGYTRGPFYSNFDSLDELFFALYTERGTLLAHRNQLRDALAASLTPAIEHSGLPASLQTPDGLARAVMAIHDGAATELLLDNQPAQFTSWLTDLLTALLDHPRQIPTSTPAKRPTANPH